MKQITLIALITLMYSVFATAEIITVNDASINAGENVTWTNDNTYILDGFVFVEETATLNIQPGTVIKGKPGSGQDASALIIARGAQIFAEGTPSNPIIFSAEADDVNNPNDFTKDDRGLWGGVIILGSAGINVAGGTEQIEGIPVEEPRGNYGGNNDKDNSGVFRYVSIRHGGSSIGANNEINGLTLGAVGSGTTIEFVEIFANLDDGFEWFGGTVNTKYLVSAFCGDDAFDYDQGFRGKGQFWFTIQDPVTAGSAGEHDGGTDPEDGQPYAKPMIYNATYLGSGINSSNAKNSPFINIRDNAGAYYYSSIFGDVPGVAVSIEDLDSGEDSRKRLENGDLEFSNNIFFNFKNGTSEGQSWTDTEINSKNRFNVDPILAGISRIADKGLDPRPLPGSPAYSDVKSPPNDGFYTQVDYVGAFGGDLWISGWTYLFESGFVSEVETSVKEIEIESNVSKSNSLDVFPNPIENNAEISFYIKDRSHVSVDVFDYLGNKVVNLVNKQLPQGSFGGLHWTPENIKKGMYFITVTTNHGNFSQKVIVK